MIDDPHDRMVTTRQAIEFVVDREYLTGRTRQPDTPDVYSRIVHILDVPRDVAKREAYKWCYR